MNKYRTINEAWFYSCRYILKTGYRYKIDRGSFSGTIREQVPALAFEIINPWERPLEVTFMGKHIVTQDQIEQYFTHYLMSEKVSENETYTYGSRLVPHIDEVINMLCETPMTNQATIEIGRPEDIELEDPPCLRLVSWKVVEGELNLSCFFRSWDVAMGMPTNLGGLQLLNEYVAEMVGLKSGSLYAYSDGAHIYVDNFKWF